MFPPSSYLIHLPCSACFCEVWLCQIEINHCDSIWSLFPLSLSECCTQILSIIRDDVTEQHSAPRRRTGGKEELAAAASSCGRENKLGREISGEHNKSEVWTETVEEDVSEDIPGESDESDDSVTRGETPGEENNTVDSDLT